MNRIELKGIKIIGNRVEFNYTFSEQLSIFFSESIKFYYEYPENIDLECVPESILIIPFVMNVMPLAWISKSLVYVKCIDESFYYSLTNVLAGLKKIHPNIDFDGALEAEAIEKNDFEVHNENKVLLFSGGVDALSSLASHYSERPILVNVWGADIHPDDNENYSVIKQDLKSLSENMNLSLLTVRSSLRWFLNEPLLSSYYKNDIKDTWWHGMQHSVGLLSLLAPFDYIHNIKTNYIASSYTKEAIGVVRCVSFPFIDSCLKIGTTDCYHDGFEYSRINKVHNIVRLKRQEFPEINIPLKVCFYTQKGDNCCKCEKCLRTMAAILVLNEKIENYGFIPDYTNAEKYIKRFLDRTIISSVSLPFWKEISQYVIENGTKNRSIEWIGNYVYNTFKSKWYTPIENGIRIKLGKIRHIIKTRRK